MDAAEIFFRASSFFLCYFEIGERSVGDVVEVGVEAYCDCDCQVRIGDDCVVRCILFEEQALDCTQNYALDVVCAHVWCSGEWRVILEYKNLCFQFCCERLAFTESIGPRGDLIFDESSRFFWVA